MSVSQRSSRFAPIKIVFLDRDGVINRKPPEGEYVTRWENLEVLPGAADAIAALNRSGRKVIVITNQRGIALGLMSEAELGVIHDRLRAELAAFGARLDAIYYCPHDRDECNCRKPKIGMIESAFEDFPDAGSENSVLIGDSLSDIECGRAAGMATIFIEARSEAEALASKEGSAVALGLADAVVGSLAEAVRLYFT